VPNVPTPREVVAELLKLTHVAKDDVVYNLGCGDGRIVIAAAKMGASEVGLDLNPDRIRESKEYAKKRAQSSEPNSSKGTCSRRTSSKRPSSCYTYFPKST
jgi:cyclopropane fatty-acyl-phospholipid synthase-like methyltransferase